MATKTVVKLILLCIISVCAFVAVGAGFIAGKKEKVNGKKQKPEKAVMDRKMVKIRLACFLVMLICLFVCVVI